MKKVILFLAVISLATAAVFFAEGKDTETGHEKLRVAGKPSAPLKISIAAVQPENEIQETERRNGQSERNDG